MQQVLSVLATDQVAVTAQFIAVVPGQLLEAVHGQVVLAVTALGPEQPDRSATRNTPPASCARCSHRTESSARKSVPSANTCSSVRSGLRTAGWRDTGRPCPERQQQHPRPGRQRAPHGEFPCAGHGEGNGKRQPESALIHASLASSRSGRIVSPPSGSHTLVMAPTEASSASTPKTPAAAQSVRRRRLLRLHAWSRQPLLHLLHASAPSVTSASAYRKMIMDQARNRLTPGIR
jgi:hypothetical protein